MLIEERIKNFLDTEFAESDVKVYLETPQTLPASFIVFDLIGRGESDYIEGTTFEFVSYAPSKYEAAILDEQVRDAMRKFHETTDISVKLGGGNNAPDTSLKRYRYRCYFNLYI